MLIIYLLTLFVSAVLLFWIEPMFAKMILPMLGSTPAVWNTCMLFYQAMLLLGYLYAHLTTTFMKVRTQAMLHIGVLLLPLLVIPISIPFGWEPTVNANPATWLLMLLSVSIGLPLFVISTTAPLMQKWFSNISHSSSNDPYFLYAASNSGSMIGLLSYPLLIEPNLRLKDQCAIWGIGYFILIVLVFLCLLVLFFFYKPASSDTSNEVDIKPNLKIKLKWLVLSFVPSSLLLGVTTYLTTEVPPIPLLWIVPLLLYLLTFIIVFSKKPILNHEMVVRFLPTIMLPLILIIIFEVSKAMLLINVYHLVVFFLIAMVCHGELAKNRPQVKHLTEFYLWLSVGGVLGGIFNALIAPRIFNSVIEYPLAILLGCLLCPSLVQISDKIKERKEKILDILFPLALWLFIIIFTLSLRHFKIMVGMMSLCLVFVPAIFLCYSFKERSLRFTLGILAILLGSVVYKGNQGQILYKERSFFGVHQVVVTPDKKFIQLIHGSTTHGLQSLNKDQRQEPLTYYYRTGPIGQIISAYDNENESWKVAAIGLGAGSTASYIKPKQEWTFYEIDPVVEKIASDPKYFTFLSESKGKANIRLGDGRLLIKKANDGEYNLIILDAFSSDSIPVHLLTKEAVQLYLSKLTSNGILAFHISNRFLNLRPVLANIASSLGLVCYLEIDFPIKKSENKLGKYPSHWVVISRKEEDIKKLLAFNSKWEPLLPTQAKVWSDDFSNIFSVISFRLSNK